MSRIVCFVLLLFLSAMLVAKAPASEPSGELESIAINVMAAAYQVADYDTVETLFDKLSLENKKKFLLEALTMTKVSVHLETPPDTLLDAAFLTQIQSASMDKTGTLLENWAIQKSKQTQLLGRLMLSLLEQSAKPQVAMAHPIPPSPIPVGVPYTQPPLPEMNYRVEGHAVYSPVERYTAVAHLPFVQVPSPPAPISQITFLGVEGLVINYHDQVPGTFDSAPLICPAIHDFRQGSIYRLKLSNIPGYPGKELFPTFEVAPTAPQTQAFLAHNSVPVEFADHDFDQVFSGNSVTKVVYLPNPEFQGIAISGVGTLVNTQLQPGVDPIVEASKRGSILAIIRMGNRDMGHVVGYGGENLYHPLPVASNMPLQYQRPESEWQIFRQLGMPVTLDINDPLPLEKALNVLCSETDIVPYLDRRALQEADIAPDTMVHLPLARGSQVGSVLNTILDQCGLTWVVKNEILHITTMKKARGEAFVRIHYVGDIVTENSIGMGGMGGGISGTGMDFTDIQSVITSVVASQTWYDGDRLMSFHFPTQSFAIRQTEEVHAQIENLLKQLRQKNDEQRGHVTPYRTHGGVVHSNVVENKEPHAVYSPVQVIRQLPSAPMMPGVPIQAKGTPHNPLTQRLFYAGNVGDMMNVVDQDWWKRGDPQTAAHCSCVFGAEPFPAQIANMLHRIQQLNEDRRFVIMNGEPRVTTKYDEYEEWMIMPMPAMPAPFRFW